MKMTRRWIWNAAVVLAIFIGFVGCRGVDELHSAARRAWKDDALAQIASRAGDDGWLKNELTRLHNEKAQSLGESERWLSDQLILMRNGDWLLYANVCRKQKGHIYDLFLSKGSDGRWYYSTYHFCSGMIVLQVEDQSETLAEFAKTYYLRTFDGRSDDCLQQTWPPPK